MIWCIRWYCQEGRTALSIAVERQRTSIATRLLQAGADVHAMDNTGKTPMLGARTACLVEMLVNAGACLSDVDQNGDGLLSLAVAMLFFDVEFVNYLLQADADKNAQNRNGHTPLMKAVKKGYLYIVEPLLKCGADIELYDKICVARRCIGR